MPSLRYFVESLPKPFRRQKLLMALYGMRFFSPEQELEFNDCARAWVDLRDAESRATYLSKSFWPEIHPMAAAFLRHGGHFFDVGANFGLVTFGVVPLLRRQGIGFHLFEANAQIIPLLKKSTAMWAGEQFEINHCCVTDRPGVSKFSLPDSHWGHGRIGKVGRPVQNLLLDEYIDERRIERIPFMKMDIEGWEPFALNGGRRTLASGKVEAVFVELSPTTLALAGSNTDALLDLLEELGFDCYFCCLYEHQDVFGLRWVRADVNGTLLRFARARPLPRAYVQGDVMAIHQSTELGRVLLTAFSSQSR